MVQNSISRVLFVLLAGLTACSGPTEQESIASAKARIEKNDGRGAVLDLKTALSEHPETAQLRLWMGKALLASGDPVAASVELGKAQELQAPPDDVAPVLARAMLALRDDRKLVAQMGNLRLSNAEAQADLLTSLATAQLRLGEPELANRLIDAALRAAPGFAAASVEQARQKAKAGDNDGALAVLDETLKRQPTLESAGLLRAELLLLAKEDSVASEKAFKEVLAAHPNSVEAHTGLIGLYALRRDAEAAKAQTAALEKAAPAHPETIYHRAQLAFAEKNYPQARELVEGLLKVLPDDVRLLELAGAVDLRSARYVQAEAYLGRALRARPGQLRPRHLLVQTYLRSGQPAKALEVLQPILAGKAPDGQSLALAGEAYLQKGDAKNAEVALQRAVKAAPKDVEVRTAFSRLQQARGEGGAAAASLEAAAAGDASPRADLALVSSRLRMNDLPGALKAVDGLQKKLPQDPLPDYLRGLVLQLQKDDTAAAKSFEAALTKRADYYDAAAMLAGIDLQAGRADAARQRFENLLKAQPNHPQALLALAELAARTGASRDAVTQKLRDAVRANPLSVHAQRVLVDQLLNSGDAPGAVAAAQSATVALPNDYEIMALLGKTFLAAQDTQQALSTLKKLSSLQPANAGYQVLLAEAYVAGKDTDAATKALNKALELSPGLPPARRGLVAVALMNKLPAEALKQVKLLQKERPKEASGFALEGDIEAGRRAWDAAAAAYRTALLREPTPEMVVKLHNALQSAGKQADADRLAIEWQKSRPSDALFQFYLGDKAMARQDFAAADALYRTVLKTQPDNALALNNLAWLAVRQGKPGGRALAEKAAALMPEQAPLLDTLAMTWAQENEWAKAIEIQKRAVARSPGDPDLKLNLAKYQLKAGQKGEARTQLEALARLGAGFKGQPEVASLLRATQ